MPTTHSFAPGDRYVWTSAPTPTAPHLRPLVLTGSYVADGPAPYVTVQHDGWDHEAQVFADQLAPEATS